MGELTYTERLQPSLLDRLTDDEPGVQKESRHKRVLSPEQLRESVRRDLVWLFNTINLFAVEPTLPRYPDVEKSVVNFGLPDLAGRTASSIPVAHIERLLCEAIWQFEPRLVRKSVKVRLHLDAKQMNHNAMSFTIDAELWAQPLPLQLFLRTEIDLESGHVNVADSTARSD